MYQHILIPVDGSPTSDRALQEAIAFARQQNAQLQLLHVIEEIHFVDIESSINYAELQESNPAGKSRLFRRFRHQVNILIGARRFLRRPAHRARADQYALLRQFVYQFTATPVRQCLMPAHGAAGTVAGR